MARGIETHLDEEEAPIPVLSPLEVASAPLEKLIEDAKTKVKKGQASFDSDPRSYNF